MPAIAGRNLAPHHARRWGSAAMSLALMSVAPATAQETQEPIIDEQILEDAAAPITLEPVVVTATGFEQAVADAPASITVITKEELEKGAFRDVTDALREVQGVTVTGPAGEKDIYIRGLPGEYTLILIDGKRQNTRDSRPNGSSGFEQSFIPPLSAIERIEVVRGPMSSLYGSDAMGGVINIITRKVAGEWGGEVTLDGTVQFDRDFGDSGQVNFYTSGPIVEDTLGIQAWGRGYIRGEDDLVSANSSAREGDIGTRLTFTPTPKHEFELGGGLTRIRRQAEAGATLEEGDTDVRSDYDRQYWKFSHDGDWDVLFTNFSVLQEWAETTDYDYDENTGNWVEDPRSPLIRNTVIDGSATIPFEALGEHTAVLGGQYTNNHLTDQNPGRRTGQDETFSINQWALFAEDEWAILDNFSLTGGLRLDTHEEYGSHLSPRVYGVWQAMDGLTIKGGVSTGFRAPEIRSIAPGYAYTTGGGRCTYGPEGTCGVIIGDPDLQPETSTSYEAGFIWEGIDAFSFGATFFWTDFRDKIQNALVLDSDGNPVRWAEDPNYRLWYSYNVDDALIRGVEVATNWQALDYLSFRGTYTFTDSEQKTGDYKGFPLDRTPKNAATLSVEWVTPIEGLSTSALFTYHGAEIASGPRLGSNGDTIYINGEEGKKYDPYFLIDLGATYALTDSVTLNAQIYNVLDKQVDATDYNTFQEGRRFWLSVTKTF
ncbi:TonB-dependent receptor [Rhodobacteraceae bacterium NNCM2]|nr:TonB-dependent receptor [Coraliihabitans acroporae]